MESLNDYINSLQCLYKLFDQCDILDQIRTQINSFPKKMKYKEIKLFISIFSLYDSNANLAQDLYKNPMKLINVLEEVACSADDVLKPNEPIKSHWRFYINIKFTDVPPIERMLMTCTNEMAFKNNRIVTFSGLIVSIEMGSKFSRSCSYSCKDKLCADPNRNFINVFYPEFPNSSVNERSGKCGCGMDYEEDMSERVLEELLEFSVLLVINRGRKQRQINRIVTCIARGDVCKLIEIGRSLYFIGYILTRGPVSNLKYEIEICNAMVPDLSVSSVEHLSWMKIWQLVPSDISRFEFGPSFMMAFMFADEVTVPGSFFLLKLLLMLLLLSNTTEHQMNCNGIKYLASDDVRYRPISLVVAANDTNITGKIINTASKYTQYFHPHGPHNLLLGMVMSRDKYMRVEYGSLLVPENHIVYIPNMLSLSCKELTQLSKVLQNRLIQPVIKSGLPMCQKNLLCKIWASIDLCGHSSNILEKFPNNMRSLMEAFDLLYVVEDLNSSDWEEVISHSLLYNCLRPHSYGCDEYHQLYHSFLQNASRITITKWSHEAELLLRGYYMIGRKITMENSPIFPQSTLSVLLQLATNLAKLNNRSIIKKCDSLLAIFIYECIYSSRSGVRLIKLRSEICNCLSHVRSINELFLEEFQGFYTICKLIFCNK